MFPQIFNVNGECLSNRYLVLDDVLPTFASFIKDSFEPGLSLEAVSERLDKRFSAIIERASFNWDIRLYRSIATILKKQGTLTIEQLDVGISERQLRRLFKYYIGDTPKTFSKVVRFQNILKAKPSTKSLRENKLFFDVGFFDQSHFIKDFKNFYGVTPTQAFR